VAVVVAVRESRVSRKAGMTSHHRLQVEAGAGGVVVRVGRPRAAMTSRRRLRAEVEVDAVVAGDRPAAGAARVQRRLGGFDRRRAGERLVHCAATKSWMSSVKKQWRSQLSSHSEETAMDIFDSSFITVIIVIGVIGGILTIAWWVFIAFIGVKAFQLVTRRLDREIPTLEQLIRQYTAMPSTRQPAARMDIISQLAHINSQLGRLDGINRDRYELRASELQGMAANAGIDWTPPPYN